MHYVLFGGTFFGMMGGIHYWFPKITGKMMSERLGRWNFWLTFIGFNVAFLPMHLTGLFGMPRRVYTYPDDFGFDTLNMITTVGSFVLAVGVLLLLINMWKSRRSGAFAGNNPWGAPTLEWATTSPPPPDNFAVIAPVAARHPQGEEALDEEEARTTLDRGMTLDKGKEALETTLMDAEPERILRMPEDSYAPLLLAIALGVLFTGMLLQLWWLAGAGGLGCLVALIAWLWPRRDLLEREVAHG
jgi:heme/copper-type cytochrome/quinol oxidase subunit 1